jgi:hypothetical protein
VTEVARRKVLILKTATIGTKQKRIGEKRRNERKMAGVANDEDEQTLFKGNFKRTCLIDTVQ